MREVSHRLAVYLYSSYHLGFTAEILMCYFTVLSEPPVVTAEFMTFFTLLSDSGIRHMNTD